MLQKHEYGRVFTISRCGAGRRTFLHGIKFRVRLLRPEISHHSLSRGVVVTTLSIYCAVSTDLTFLQSRSLSMIGAIASEATFREGKSIRCYVGKGRRNYPDGVGTGSCSYQDDSSLAKGALIADETLIRRLHLSQTRPLMHSVRVVANRHTSRTTVRWSVSRDAWSGKSTCDS